MLLGESGLARLWERVVDYVNKYVETYDSLAVATKRKRGQVRPDGTSITVDEDGTIHSVGGQAPAPATTDAPGIVRPDGTTITVDADGTISSVSGAETDPTVPAWAKARTKPTYTASEVGALPASTVIPSKTSQLANDSGYVTSVPTRVSELVNDRGYVTSVPTRVSELANDSGYITGVPTATTSTAGKVRPDGETITVDADGTIHGAAQVDVATGASAGIVRPDGTSVTIDTDGTIHATSEASGPHWEVRSVDGVRRLVIVIPEE